MNRLKTNHYTTNKTVVLPLATGVNRLKTNHYTTLTGYSIYKIIDIPEKLYESYSTFAA